MSSIIAPDSKVEPPVQAASDPEWGVDLDLADNTVQTTPRQNASRRLKNASVVPPSPVEAAAQSISSLTTFVSTASSPPNEATRALLAQAHAQLGVCVSTWPCAKPINGAQAASTVKPTGDGINGIDARRRSSQSDRSILALNLPHLQQMFDVYVTIMPPNRGTHTLRDL
jgi:hypothetical protein